MRVKLTLSIDRDVIREARKQGGNLSGMVERYLKAVTLVSQKNELYNGYQQFFGSINTIIKEFGINLKIAKSLETVTLLDENGKEYEVERPLSIFLTPEGSFYINEDDKYFESIYKIPPEDFLKPETILSNLLNSLAETRKTTKEKMSSLLMAKNIVDAISGTLGMKRSESTDSSSIPFSIKKYRKTKTKKREKKRKKSL